MRFGVCRTPVNTPCVLKLHGAVWEVLNWTVLSSFHALLLRALFEDLWLKGSFVYSFFKKKLFIWQGKGQKKGGKRERVKEIERESVCLVFQLLVHSNDLLLLGLGQVAARNQELHPDFPQGGRQGTKHFRPSSTAFSATEAGSWIGKQSSQDLSQDLSGQDLL